MSMDEKRQIRFRCAQNGMAFHVEFTRPSTDEMFKISGYEKISMPIVDDTAEGDVIVSAEQIFDINEFDTTNWTCFFCGHCVDECNFIRCGRCEELFCGSRVRALPDGKLEFHCHTGCGRVGIVSDTLTSLSGAAHEEDQHLLPGDEKANQNIQTLTAAIGSGGNSPEVQKKEFRRLGSSSHENEKA